MKSSIFATILLLAFYTVSSSDFEKDVFKTSDGELGITFIGHGTLMMEFKGTIIHIDPFSSVADYTSLPKADLILITHEHGDHLDAKAIDALKKENTQVVLTEICNKRYSGTDVLKNGDSGTFNGIKIEAVPAYNIKHERQPGHPFHPKGNGNGYVLHFGDTKVYVAGDTENIPEMADLKNIDVAFLPMNIPYTMTPEMVGDAIKMFNPKILYPYHLGNTNTDDLKKIMVDNNIVNTELRIRKFN